MRFYHFQNDQSGYDREDSVYVRMPAKYSMKGAKNEKQGGKMHKPKRHNSPGVLKQMPAKYSTKGAKHEKQGGKMHKKERQIILRVFSSKELENVGELDSVPWIEMVRDVLGQEDATRVRRGYIVSLPGNGWDGVDARVPSG